MSSAVLPVMACFQIKATLANGATVLFGVQAKDTEAAQSAGRASLAHYPHQVSELQVLELGADRRLTRSGGAP